MASHESPLIPLYAHYSDQQNHLRSHFLNSSKHLTTLIVTILGAFGADSRIRLCIRGHWLRRHCNAACTCVSTRVFGASCAKGWANYDDDIFNRHNRIELLIAQDVADGDFLELVERGRATTTVRSNF